MILNLEVDTVKNGSTYNVNFSDIVSELPNDLNYLASLEEFKFFNPDF